MCCAVRRLGYKVALLDADVGLRNLDLLLGLENRVLYTAIDILEGDCRYVCVPKLAAVLDCRSMHQRRARVNPHAQQWASDGHVVLPHKQQLHTCLSAHVLLNARC